MSCYHPLKALKIGYRGDGKEALKIVPYDSIEEFKPDGSKYDFYTIPCGKCIGCRQDQSAEWSNRLLLESLYHDKTFFLTLTYDNDHLHPVLRVKPNTGEIVDGATLSKRDWQLFMKSLRNEFPDAKIRFYAAGEYGPRSCRPHIHSILFGLPLDDSELIPFGKSETGDPYYICPRLQSIWNRGNISIEPANYYTFKYVSSYVTSKVGRYPNDYWKKQNLEPPFALMSRKPGIGSQYLIDHPEIMENDRIVISLETGAVEFPPPRYFRKSFKEVFPDDYQVAADRHQKKANDKRDAEMIRTDKEYIDYLKVKESEHYAKMKERKSF